MKIRSIALFVLLSTITAMTASAMCRRLDVAGRGIVCDDDTVHNSSNSNSSSPPITSNSSTRNRQAERASAAAALSNAVESYLRGKGSMPENMLDQETQNEFERQSAKIKREAEKESFDRIEQERLKSMRSAELEQARRTAAQDPKLNPWSSQLLSGTSSDTPLDGNSQQSKFAVLDPAENHEGKSCSYFTVKNDDSHIYSHAEGATVIYGEIVYICQNNVWKYKYSASVYNKRDRNKIDAKYLERSK